MDPLGIATSVITTAIAIETWIDQRRKRDETVNELRHTVSRIAIILAPMQPEPQPHAFPGSSSSSKSSTWVNLDPAITTCLQDMREILGRIQDDLMLWMDKRSKKTAIMDFLRPSVVLGRIQDDEKRLSRRSDTLSFALQVYFLRKAHEQTQLKAVEAHGPPPSALDEVRNAEVKSFWRERVGEDMSFINGADLCRELGAWLDVRLDPTTRDTILLRLDEYAVGGVTPSSLDEFVGRRSIRSAITSLGVLGSLAAEIQFEPIDVSKVKPLIVWIDDCPENNEYYVEKAKRWNITVISLRSTAAAKAWIEANAELLRRADYARRLRFISDNCRWETPEGENGVVENLAAGEAILRYLRGRLYRAPVLIYCGYSIAQTKYILSFRRAGSTVHMHITEKYISALGKGEDEDQFWEGFNVS